MHINMHIDLSINQHFANIVIIIIIITQNEHENLTPSQKMIVIASQLLVDYNYFNGVTEMCSNSEQALTCYFFYCSPYGCVQPCCCMLPKQQQIEKSSHFCKPIQSSEHGYDEVESIKGQQKMIC